MVVTFLAGMLCGAVLLITVVVATDRSFLELIRSRFLDDEPDSERPQARDVKTHRSVAVGRDS